MCQDLCQAQTHPAPTSFEHEIDLGELIMIGTHKTNGMSFAEGNPAVKPSIRLVLTERDCSIIRWIYEVRATTREQIQQVFFGPGGRSRCQHRLMLLVENRYVDRLPRRSASDPDVFYLSRRAYKGLRVLRASAQNEVVPVRLSPLRVPHIVALAGCRAIMTAASRDASMNLDFWVDERYIAPLTEAYGLIPDGYFQIRRETPEGTKRAAFFIEVERSGKSKQALASKFSKYAQFYYQGHYERLFGTKALRTLFLVDSEYEFSVERQVEHYVRICEQVGATFFRFATLNSVMTHAAAELFSAHIWRQPRDNNRRSLF